MVWFVLSTGALVVIWGVAAVAALRAARTSRTPQGAIGWVVFLLSAPMIALPAFMVFGDHRFRGYWRARRAAERALLPRRAKTSALSEPPLTLPINPAPFEAIAGFKICRGNDMILLVNGRQTFDSIFEAIDGAQEYILLQYYILRSDGIGDQLHARLLAAAKRGVKIWMMVDKIGSRQLPRAYIEELELAGIHLVAPGRYRRPWTRMRINFRNHRKTVIVDGRIGFTGGINVGDEYLGLSPALSPWRDTHVRLSGPVVLQLQLSFAEDWHWYTQEPILDHLHWEPHPGTEDRPALIAATGPGDAVGNGSMLYFSAITAAQERVWLASPYFVPDQEVSAALQHASLRGVDVRILLPEKVDHYLPWLASFAFFDELQAAGVQIYRYRDGFMHQKCFVVDETLSGVGTCNLDNRSFRLNFETMALLFDQASALDVAEMLERDFVNASDELEPLSQQKPLLRIMAPMARLLAPVL
ncbi:cardiolipin synthase [Leisingera sp.]|uniref:cardiolipin synthase n=1 Tax=Leisingera sp. TaxID=1879318 RepID=UPI003A8F3CFA